MPRRHLRAAPASHLPVGEDDTSPATVADVVELEAGRPVEKVGEVVGPEQHLATFCLTEAGEEHAFNVALAKAQVHLFVLSKIIKQICTIGP